MTTNKTETTTMSLFGKLKKRLFRRRYIEASFESTKKLAKRFSDLLNTGDITNKGTSSYWSMLFELWKDLKIAMGE